MKNKQRSIPFKNDSLRYANLDSPIFKIDDLKIVSTIGEIPNTIKRRSYWASFAFLFSEDVFENLLGTLKFSLDFLSLLFLSLLRGLLLLLSLNLRSEVQL